MNYSFVDATFLERVVLNILNNRPNVEFEEKYLDEKITQRAKIQELVDKTTRGAKKAFNLTIFKAGDVNIIDVNVNIAKDEKGKLIFYLSGRGLKTYCSRLLHFVIINQCGKNMHYPQNGSNFTKWYPFIGRCIPIMLDMATNFRLLELYLREQRVHRTIVDSKNILGIDIPIEIPDVYQPYTFLTRGTNNIHNPKKMGTGKYIFGRNGITTEHVTKIVEIIRNKFYHLHGKIYPMNIDTDDLKDFYKSKHQFAIGSFSTNHERLLIKYDGSIFIVDPWMKYLPKKIMKNIDCEDETINVEFLQRSISDQDKEGSCVLCCIARMLYIADSLTLHDVYTKENIEQLVNEPITDFYAYLAHFVFRQSLFV